MTHKNANNSELFKAVPNTGKKRMLTDVSINTKKENYFIEGENINIQMWFLVTQGKRQRD